MVEKKKKLFFNNSPPFAKLLLVNWNSPGMLSLANPQFSHRWSSNVSVTRISRRWSKTSQKNLEKFSFRFSQIDWRKVMSPVSDWDTIFLISEIRKKTNRSLDLNSVSKPKASPVCLPCFFFHLDSHFSRSYYSFPTWSFLVMFVIQYELKFLCHPFLWLLVWFN